ncbi:NADPH-dependent ferric siderophore reductase [Leucobacter komagatae]|uniref:NADPH-dependent ferric siderophore reductase n=1 Tax=Leucobacter komagatae TaxID=55969 RepID=A0A542Y7U5_9MICO|nr:siderophore-interacting protein [Leucobacter komagatae]TQL44170.1 NADPH-dependent ferric siderophore reductase [Leucobacter komagatae]
MTQAARFQRERTMYRFTAREVTVKAVSRPVPSIARVTLAGPDLYDFESTGPGDHAKIFFPHPFTGELLAPTAVGPGEDGIVRPDGQTFGRDFTPLNVRDEDGGRVFDLDFFLHDDPGPASAWAEKAAVGDKIVVVGPRGTQSIPTGITSLLCLVDPTALPATVRWINGLPDATEIEVIADVDYDALDWVEEYLREGTGREILVREPLGGLDQALLDSEVTDETFVFAAGDANRLIPLRRVIRDELGLPRAQYQISGYWRRGEANFDHHGPIDPNDPESVED